MREQEILNKMAERLDRDQVHIRICQASHMRKLMRAILKRTACSIIIGN